MRQIGLALAGLAVLAACQARDPGYFDMPTNAAAAASDKARLIAAIEANGCQLDPTNAAAITAQSGLSQEAIVALGRQLVDEGRADLLTTGVLELKTGACA